MRLDVGTLPVVFPFATVYPEQVEFMTRYYQILLRAWSRNESGSYGNNHHGLIEMPTGTGKTVAFLSVALAFKQQNRNVGPLIVVTRTVAEVTQTINELKRLVEFRKVHPEETGGERFDKNLVCLALSSRRNLCVNEDVMATDAFGPLKSVSVDGRCRARTTEWARELPDFEECPFFETHLREQFQHELGGGVYSLHDLRELGRARGVCPYWLARQAVATADVLVLTYPYLLSPRVSLSVMQYVPQTAIVVFDEAHNLDHAATESLSMYLTRADLDLARQNLGFLRKTLTTAEREERKRVSEECTQLLSCDRVDISYSSYHRSPLDVAKAASALVPSPILFTDFGVGALPGTIIDPSAFLRLLRKLIEALRQELKNAGSEEATVQFLRSFAKKLEDNFSIEPDSLAAVPERLQSLFRTFRISNTASFLPIITVASFAAYVGTYGMLSSRSPVLSHAVKTGSTPPFVMILEAQRWRLSTKTASMKPVFTQGPVIRLVCLDPTLALAPSQEGFRSVLYTSGTLEPFELFTRLIGLAGRPASDAPTFAAHAIGSHSLRAPLRCMVTGRGSDQNLITSSYAQRAKPTIVKNYGQLVLDMSRVVPDGLVVFFPSYRFMADMVDLWRSMGMFEPLAREKLLFFEAPDLRETAVVTKGFEEACDMGRGAILFAVARGKVAEGIDFKYHYGRGCVVIGVPFPNTSTLITQARLEYFSSAFGVEPSKFIQFDGVRAAAQCVGRVVRAKDDYSVAVLADHRFGKEEVHAMLPKWIRQATPGNLLDASIEQSRVEARRFLAEKALLSTKEGWGNLLNAEKGVGVLARDAAQALAATLLEPGSD